MKSFPISVSRLSDSDLILMGLLAPNLTHVYFPFVQNDVAFTEGDESKRRKERAVVDLVALKAAVGQGLYGDQSRSMLFCFVFNFSLILLWSW
jgi:hypothetical protein